MKNRTPWIIAFLMLCIVLLLVLGVFLAKNARARAGSYEQISTRADMIASDMQELQSDADPEEDSGAAFIDYDSEAAPAEAALTMDEQTEHAAEQSPRSAGETLPETEPLSERSLPSASSVSKEHQVIFVGDSRTVGMGKAEAKRGDHCVYVGESGEGYHWLIETGIDRMDEAIRSHPGAPVVLNLGVNDCDAVNAYIEVYREIEKGYPDTYFYYMSVNPVTEDSPHVPLEDVLAFNQVLKAAFPAQYIDTCSWMLREGFEDVDGVHYSEAQYCAIHDFAVDAVFP